MLLKSFRSFLAVVVALSMAMPSSYAARPAATGDSSPVRAAWGTAISAGGASGFLVTQGLARSESRQVRHGFGTKEAFFTNSIAVYNLQALLKAPLDQIPDAVMDKIRHEIDVYVQRGWLKSGVVNDVGGTSIVLHVTHNYGELNASIHRLMLDAIREGLQAMPKNLNLKVSDLDAEALARKLQVVANDDSKKERGAESVSIAVGSGVSIGAVNIKLMNQFALLGSTPLQKLGLSKSPGFRFRVKPTADILAGKFDGAEWEFEISVDQYNAEHKLVRKGRYEGVQLLALAGQPNDYQITAVYPVEGGGLPADEPIASVVYQPVFGSEGKQVLNPVIIYRSQSGADAVGGIGGQVGNVQFVPGGETGDHFVATKPVTMEQLRKKPKEPGVGYFGVYGYQSRNDGEIPSEGVRDHVALSSFGYFYEQELAVELAAVMSDHENDQPFLSPGASERLVHVQRHGQSSLFSTAPKESDADPFMAGVEARIQSEALSVVVDDKADMGGRWGHTSVPELFTAIYRATLIEAMEAGRIPYGQTLGFAGNPFRQVGDVENVGVGDDGHMVILNDRSPGSFDAHQLSFLAFTRAYLAAVLTGKKYYGIGQDFAGPEAQAAKKNPFAYAKLTARFFEILEQVLPENEKKLGVIEKIRTEWSSWEAKESAGPTLTEPFSGNVSQQGMGSARYAFDPATEKTFDILAGDKMGPAALNRLIKNTVYNALNAGRFKNGLVFEIWDLKAFEDGKIPADDFPKKILDVQMLIEHAAKANRISDKDAEWALKDAYAGKTLRDLDAAESERLENILRLSGFVPTKRIFLDAEKDKEAVIRYLADSDRFNVKHVWGKKSKDWDWDIDKLAQFLDRPLLGASVTRLGILSGGEYLGKDDPVMIGHSDLMNFAFEFLRTRPLIIQGDMNGSHWEQAMPTGMKDAVATARSFPVMVGLRYTVAPDGKSLKSVKDIFADKKFDPARKRTSKFNHDFNQATMGGQVEPHGTNSRTVEAAYELAKILRDLNASTSPFLVSNKIIDAGRAVEEQAAKAARGESTIKVDRAFVEPAGNFMGALYKEVVKQRSESRISVGAPEAANRAVANLNVERASDSGLRSKAGLQFDQPAIFSPELAFDQGGLALVAALAATAPAAVLVEDERQRAFVEAINLKLPQNQKIVAASSVEEAMAAIRARIRGKAVVRAFVTSTSSFAEELRSVRGIQLEIVTPTVFQHMAASIGFGQRVVEFAAAYRSFTQSA